MQELSCRSVECDDDKFTATHDVSARISFTEDGYLVDVTEQFGERKPGTGWADTKQKRVFALKPALEDAVKLAGRLAKNAGIDESGLIQALSQAYVAAVKVDRERLANEELGALLTDTPCQES